MTTFSVVERPAIDPTTSAEHLEILNKYVIPMLEEYWEEEGKKLHDKPFYIDLLSFLIAWANNGLMVLTAVDENDQPEGAMIVFLNHPLLYKASVAQVEILYGRSTEIKEGLFKTFVAAFPTLAPDEIFIPAQFELAPGCSPGQRKEKLPVIRYVRR